MSSAYACGICANQLRQQRRAPSARFCEWRELNDNFYLKNQNNLF